MIKKGADVSNSTLRNYFRIVDVGGGVYGEGFYTALRLAYKKCLKLEKRLVELHVRR